MLKKTSLATLFIVSNLAVHGAFADNQALSSIALQQRRLATVETYVNALRQHNATAMVKLFTGKGQVVSTSQGYVPANSFYSSFLPYIHDTSVKVKNVYFNMKRGDRLAGTMAFHWVDADGHTEGGVYMDEFEFAPHSDRLMLVRMYENAKMD